MTSREPQFPDPLATREIVRPGGQAHKAGLDIPRRIAALEQGAIGRAHLGPPIDWTTPTLGTGWTQYGDAAYGPLKYSRDAIGNVWIRGLLVTDGTTATAFNLPAGCRPGEILIIGSQDVTAAAPVFVSSDGNVGQWLGASVRAWVSFSVSFRAEQ